MLSRPPSLDVRVALRDFRQATRLPPDLVEALARATALADPAWAAARQAGDWGRFAPHLDRIVDLVRRTAEAYGYDEHPLDPLIDLHEPGMTRARLAAVFAELRPVLIPMVGALVAQQDGRQAPLDGDFGEAGHGMYEQGIARAYARSPLAGGASTGVHESQSRLWENQVGRSRRFWQAFYPRLRELFPEALGAVGLEAFYRAINRAAPTPIRVEADELTYNLHVLLRFELEAELLDGRLAVSGVPAAWNARMAEYLAIVPEDDAEGALQDVHWSSGAFGYFPTYTVGNLLSAQLYEAAAAARPEIPEEMERGAFDALRAWLAESVWRHGRKYDPDELVTRATGRPLEPGPYLRYLGEKFGELYRIDL